MEKLKRQQIFTLPNGLTIIRVIAIPIILFLLFFPERIFQWVTACLFLSVSLTDMLDGYLARRQGMVTTLGKFLDPLADKLLVVTTLIALMEVRGIPLWMVLTIVGREIAVTGLRGIAATQEIIFSASILGKYKTSFEVAALFILILNGEILTIQVYQVGMGLLWIALVLSILSGIDYFKKFLKSIIV
ncbi:MAG: CDP-diacylglycerol--glycerol-3-phosphate 3-phosphatidyltransferase [Thermodesulfobacteriota bacterium]